MLGKLLKYEFRATARILLPLYGTMVLLAILNRGALSLLPSPDGPFVSLINVLLMITYVSIICATAFMTIFLMAQRFYKNLLGDEGYLMFTLPVPVWKNITGKLIVSVAWSILSALVTFLSIFIVAFKKEMLLQLPDMIRSLKEWLLSVGFPLNAHLVLYTVELLLITAAGLACAVLIIYASIAIGHLFHRLRMMFSFAAFIGFSILAQIISYIGVRLLINLDLDALALQIGMIAAAHLFFCGFLFLLLLSGTVYFLITNYTLKNHLNLE